MTDLDDKTSELIAKLLSEDNAYLNYYDDVYGADGSDDSEDGGYGRRKKAKKGLIGMALSMKQPSSGQGQAHTITHRQWISIRAVSDFLHSGLHPPAEFGLKG